VQRIERDSAAAVHDRLLDPPGEAARLAEIGVELGRAAHVRDGLTELVRLIGGEAKLMGGLGCAGAAAFALRLGVCASRSRPARRCLLGAYRAAASGPARSGGAARAADGCGADP